MDFEITVGRLLCRHVRDYLEAMRFRGHDIAWIESSGFIERSFVVKGEPASIQRVARDLRQWSAQLDISPS